MLCTVSKTSLVTTFFFGKNELGPETEESLGLDEQISSLEITHPFHTVQPGGDFIWR